MCKVRGRPGWGRGYGIILDTLSDVLWVVVSSLMSNSHNMEVCITNNHLGGVYYLFEEKLLNLIGVLNYKGGQCWS